MLRLLARLFLFALWILPLHAQAGLPEAANVPGGVAIVALGGAVSADKPQARFGDQPVLVAAEHGEWYAVVGLPLDLAPGSYELSISTDGKTTARHFAVNAKDYPEQHITLKDSGKVDLSAHDLARAEREIALIKELKRHWREAPDTDLDFIKPVEGKPGSAFGLRRFFNGEPRAPHSGMDMVVARGTPVKASARGTVLAVGDYFFNGKTVFIDHGNGLITMYCHLDRIDVKAGASIRKGDILGHSGKTGRATGPHLHWSVVLNGAMVDPALFIAARPARQ